MRLNIDRARFWRRGTFVQTLRLAVIAAGMFVFGWAGSQQASAQLVREHDAKSVRAFHGGTARIRRSFQSDQEARNVLRQILVAAGLTGIEDRILLRASADTSNAEALIDGNDRLILYNAVFMQEIRKKTKTYWSLVAILAHELGHHVRFHTAIDGRAHEFELEADYQAGHILRRMGATLEQAQELFKTFPKEASATHPGRNERLQAVTLGWTDGGGVAAAPIVDVGPSSAGAAKVATSPVADKRAGNACGVDNPAVYCLWREK